MTLANIRDAAITAAALGVVAVSWHEVQHTMAAKAKTRDEK